MGLLKKMLSRGLSGAESAEPWSDAPDQNTWPPNKPPESPPTPVWEPPPEAVVGLEHWRHPVLLQPQELWEQGFERVGTTIEAAFVANGQAVELATVGSELAVNDVRFVTRPRSSAVNLKHLVTGDIQAVDAAVWAVTVALHDAYLEPLDPERSWQIASVGDGYVLFLARPEELRAIARRPEIDTVVELGKHQPVA